MREGEIEIMKVTFVSFFFCVRFQNSPKNCTKRSRNQIIYEPLLLLGLPFFRPAAAKFVLGCLIVESEENCILN